MLVRSAMAAIATAMIVAPHAVFAQYRGGDDQRDRVIRREAQIRGKQRDDSVRNRIRNRDNVRDFNDWWYEDYNDDRRRERRGRDGRRDRDRRDDVRDYEDWWYEDYGDDRRRDRRGRDGRRERDRRDDVRDYEDWWYEDYGDDRRRDRRRRDARPDAPYSWHDGRWWYRMPEGYWMYYEGGEWRRNRSGTPYPPTRRPAPPQYRYDRRYDDDIRTGAQIGSEIGGALWGRRGAQAGADIGAAIGRAADR